MDDSKNRSEQELKESSGDVSYPESNTSEGGSSLQKAGVTIVDNSPLAKAVVGHAAHVVTGAAFSATAIGAVAYASSLSAAPSHVRRIDMPDTVKGKVDELMKITTEIDLEISESKNRLEKLRADSRSFLASLDQEIEGLCGTDS